MSDNINTLEVESLENCNNFGEESAPPFRKDYPPNLFFSSFSNSGSSKTGGRQPYYIYIVVFNINFHLLPLIKSPT